MLQQHRADCVYRSVFRPRLFSLKKIRNYSVLCEGILLACSSLAEDLDRSGYSHEESISLLDKASLVVMEYLGDVKNHVTEIGELKELIRKLYTGNGPFNRLSSAQPADASFCRSRFWAALYDLVASHPNEYVMLRESVLDSVGWMVTENGKNRSKLVAELKIMSSEHHDCLNELGAHVHRYLTTLPRVVHAQNHGGLAWLVSLGADLPACAEALNNLVSKGHAEHKSLPALYLLSLSLNDHLLALGLIDEETVIVRKSLLLEATLAAASHKGRGTQTSWAEMIEPLADYLSKGASLKRIATFALHAPSNAVDAVAEWIKPQDMKHEIAGFFAPGQEVEIIGKLRLQPAYSHHEMLMLHGDRLMDELGI